MSREWESRDFKILNDGSIMEMSTMTYSETSVNEWRRAFIYETGTWYVIINQPDLVVMITTAHPDYGVRFSYNTPVKK